MSRGAVRQLAHRRELVDGLAPESDGGSRSVQQGALSLSDTIDEFELDYASDVTVEMLLNHTSGVPNYTSDAWFLARYLGFPTRTWDPTELLDVISGSELQFEPGARHEYSNSNYVLLGLVLEDVTGQPYGTLVRRFVREDAGFEASSSTASSSSATLARFPATQPSRCITTIPSTPSRSSATSRRSTKRAYSVVSSRSCWRNSTDR